MTPANRMSVNVSNKKNVMSPRVKNLSSMEKALEMNTMHRIGRKSEVRTSHANKSMSKMRNLAFSTIGSSMEKKTAATTILSEDFRRSNAFIEK